MLQYSISIYLLYGCPNCAASIVLVILSWHAGALCISQRGWGFLPTSIFSRRCLWAAMSTDMQSRKSSRAWVTLHASQTYQYMSLEESQESDMKHGASELRSKSGKGWLAPSKSTKHASSASSATASAVGWQLKIRGGCYACCNTTYKDDLQKDTDLIQTGTKEKSIWTLC